MMSAAMNKNRADGTPALNMRERLIGLVRQILGAPAASRPLPIDARLYDLGMSSLKMVNLMLAIEAEFDIVIPQREITPEHFESITSVEMLLARLSRSAGGTL
jgi:acyl carrier protein